MLRASSKRESREAELSIWQISLHVIYRVKYSSRDAQLTETSALHPCTHAERRGCARARARVHVQSCQALHTHTCSYARSPHSRTGARHARAESSRVSTRQEASEKSNLDVAVSRLRPKRAHEETQKVEAGFLHRANVACFGVDEHVRHNQPQIVRIVCSLCARAHITNAVGGRRGQAVQWTGIGIGSAESRTVLSTHPRARARVCMCCVRSERVLQTLALASTAHRRTISARRRSLPGVPTKIRLERSVPVILLTKSRGFVGPYMRPSGQCSPSPLLHVIPTTYAVR